MTEMIVTDYVSKQYKNGPKAVEQVSLTIKQGEIYGFIGLNGAGKTTFIQMLLGMAKPTEGACFINGSKVTWGVYKMWEHVGYMVETPYSYPELTVEENLNIIRKLRLIDDPHAVPRIIDMLKLTRYQHTKAGKLSLGNAQRLGIAKALLHRPKILILDEPMNGLDPEGIVEIRKLLQDLALNHGVTIFISSHILSEVTKLATKIGIIHNGRIVKELKTHALHAYLHRSLTINTNDNHTAQKVLLQAGHSPIVKEDSIELLNEQAIEFPGQIATQLVYNGIPPTRLIVEEESLEDYFLKVIHAEGGVI